MGDWDGNVDCLSMTTASPMIPRCFTMSSNYIFFVLIVLIKRPLVVENAFKLKYSKLNYDPDVLTLDK